MKLLVIDVQKGITDEELYAYDSFVANVKTLIETARKNSVEIIYVQHDDGPGSGFTFGDEAFEISELFAPKEGEKIFVKEINSAFGNKEFAAYLESQGDKDLMIIGLQTNFCIDATIKSAFERGYKVYVPDGANSTFDNDYMTGETTCKYYNDFIWPSRFVDSIYMEDAIALLEGKSIE